MPKLFFHILSFEIDMRYFRVHRNIFCLLREYELSIMPVRKILSLHIVIDTGNLYKQHLPTNSMIVIALRL